VTLAPIPHLYLALNPLPNRNLPLNLDLDRLAACCGRRSLVHAGVNSMPTAQQIERRPGRDSPRRSPPFQRPSAASPRQGRPWRFRPARSRLFIHPADRIPQSHLTNRSLLPLVFQNLAHDLIIPRRDEDIGRARPGIDHLRWHISTLVESSLMIISHALKFTPRWLPEKNPAGPIRIFLTRSNEPKKILYVITFGTAAFAATPLRGASSPCL